MVFNPHWNRKRTIYLHKITMTTTAGTSKEVQMRFLVVVRWVDEELSGELYAKSFSFYDEFFFLPCLNSFER